MKTPHHSSFILLLRQYVLKSFHLFDGGSLLESNSIHQTIIQLTTDKIYSILSTQEAQVNKQQVIKQTMATTSLAVVAARYGKLWGRGHETFPKRIGSNCLSYKL